MASHPRVLYAERTNNILDGFVQSETDPEEEYVVRFKLELHNMTCTCPGVQKGGNQCKHVEALLRSLSKNQLVQMLLEGVAVYD